VVVHDRFDVMPPLLPWLNCASASGNKLHRGWGAHFNDSVQPLAVYKGSTPHILDELLPPISYVQYIHNVRKRHDAMIERCPRRKDTSLIKTL